MLAITPMHEIVRKMSEIGQSHAFLVFKILIYNRINGWHRYSLPLLKHYS